ncbi:MAG: hypothetical protein ACF8K1_06050 [Phycisphaerales bacterium JB047]
MSEQQRGLFAQIRTVIVVTLIAAMVWLLAESRMVRSRTIEAQLTISSGQPTGEIEFVMRQSSGDVGSRTVTIEIEGSTAGLDRFARELQNRVELRLGREVPPRPGEHTLDLRSVLRDSPNLDVHGVTVKAITPPEIVIEVDELEVRELRVQAMLPPGVQTDGSPRVEPASVQLRAPSALLADLKTQLATVTLSSAQLAQLTPGRLETVPGGVVEIEGIAPSDWATSISPAQVDVLLTLKTVTQRLELDPLPVQVLIAPGEIGDWRVEIDDTDRDLVGVLIEGPVEGIEALRSKSTRPRAYVLLSFEDLERGVSAKPAQIMNLPPGCRVVSPERTVGLRISREPASGTNPAQPGENPGP